MRKMAAQILLLDLKRTICLWFLSIVICCESARVLNLCIWFLFHVPRNPILFLWWWNPACISVCSFQEKNKIFVIEHFRLALIGKDVTFLRCQNIYCIHQTNRNSFLFHLPRLTRYSVDHQLLIVWESYWIKASKNYVNKNKLGFIFILIYLDLYLPGISLTKNYLSFGQAIGSKLVKNYVN